MLCRGERVGHPGGVLEPQPQVFSQLLPREPGYSRPPYHVRLHLESAGQEHFLQLSPGSRDVQDGIVCTGSVYRICALQRCHEMM